MNTDTYYWLYFLLTFSGAVFSLKAGMNAYKEQDIACFFTIAHCFCAVVFFVSAFLLKAGQ